MINQTLLGDKPMQLKKRYVTFIRVGVLAIGLALSASIRAQDSINVETHKIKQKLAPDSFAKGWTEAWNSRNVDRILTYYTEDAFYEDVPSVENGWDVPLRGHQKIRESLVKTFKHMSDLGFEFVSASGAGDRMVVEWIMTGTHWRDFTGKFSIRGVSILKLEGDKITSDYDYYDMYQVLLKLGMVRNVKEEQPKTSKEVQNKQLEYFSLRKIDDDKLF